MKTIEKCIEKGIYERGPFQYRTRIMIGGERLNATFETLEEARAYLNMKRANVALDPEASHVAATRVKREDANTWTIARLLDDYEQKVTPTKRGASTERHTIAKIRRFRLAKVSAYRVDREDILDFFDDLREDTRSRGREISETTLRKYASLLSNLFKIATKRWGMHLKNPIPQIELPKANRPRQRRLDNNLERDYFFQALAKARRKQALLFAQLAMETAMRRGELFALRWDQIKIDKSGKHGSALLHLTKNGETRVVPLATEACEIFAQISKQAGDPRVFQLTKTQLRSAWESAIRRGKANYEADCAKDGIQAPADFLRDLRFHDLRHEATSSLFELGLDRVEAAAVTGHKTLQTLKDYTHLRAEKLAKRINKAREQERSA